MLTVHLELDIQVPCLLRYATSPLSLPWLFLPFCLNAVPAPVSGGVSFILARSCLGDTSPKKHIPFSRSFSCNRRFGQQKKPAHKCVPTHQRAELPLGDLVSHSCNQLWNSKSKLPFTLSVCRQFKAASEAAVFSLSTSQALSDLKSSFKICENQYSVVALRKECFIIYQQTSVCQYFPKSFWIFFGEAGNTI